MSDAGDRKLTVLEQIEDGTIDSLTVSRNTKFAHMGYRVAYTFIAWIVLAYGVMPGTGFFTSLVLFSLPLFFDYLRFDPYEKWRKRIRVFELIFTGIIICLGVIGLIGIIMVVLQRETLMVVVSNHYLIFKGVSAPLYVLWGSLSISAVLTVVDYFLYKESFDDKFLTYHYAKGQRRKR